MTHVDSSAPDLAVDPPLAPAPSPVGVVVPHTHWDREWYASFQSFRLRLVDLLDDLLPRMEDDPSYARFLLDGQLAVVDDYLAVRPEQADRLRRLVGSGRVAVVNDEARRLLHLADHHPWAAVVHDAVARLRTLTTAPVAAPG